MSVVQTTYPNFHAAWVAGQIADTQTCDIDSMVLTGGDAVAFGRGVRLHSGERGVELGGARPAIAQLSADITNNATDAEWDNEGNPYSEVAAGQHIIIGSEILYVSAATATGGTVARGALGSSAFAHTDNEHIYYLHGAVDFRGVAVMDERLPAARNLAFETGDIMPVLWRGDIVVPVSGAVSADDAAVLTIDASAGDELGSFSSRAPDSDHILIPGAHFLTAAVDNGLAVLRLTGQHRRSF